MNRKTLFRNPPSKLKSFKNDIAPVGFYFDLFTTDLFKIPVMPIPMRIDKISNGEPTLFIFPDFIKLNKLCEKLDLFLDFQLFFVLGIKNLINFTKNKYKEITFRPLDDNKIRKWFINSKIINTDISFLNNDFTFLISEFLKLYSNINANMDLEEYHPDLIKYCNTIINFLKEKIENNILHVENDNIIKTEKLYEERENKYFPNIITIKVYNSNTKKMKEMNFIPYLIYDDLFDSFCYNKKLLLEHNFSLFNLQSWKKNNIINNGSKTNEVDSEKLLKNIDLEKLD
ncbi:MAG: hypothetical protein ACFE8M_01000 [Candidatus Hermodarchaeota archaeon]